jgi:hypothetical protein
MAQHVSAGFSYGTPLGHAALVMRYHCRSPSSDLHRSDAVSTDAIIDADGGRSWAKVVYSVTMSLEGALAGPGVDLS